MDRLKTAAKQALQYFADYLNPKLPGVRQELIFDDENGHYLLKRVGWDEDKFVYQTVFHLDVIEDKIWIQYNGTDCLIGEELNSLGILNSEIVLGLKHPSVRPYTDFAEAYL
ncbi:MAG: XisI protein [Bacteroidota bacterium]